MEDWNILLTKVQQNTFVIRLPIIITITIIIIIIIIIISYVLQPSLGHCQGATKEKMKYV